MLWGFEKWNLPNKAYSDYQSIFINAALDVVFDVPVFDMSDNKHFANMAPYSTLQAILQWGDPVPGSSKTMFLTQQKNKPKKKSKLAEKHATNDVGYTEF